MPTPPAWPSSLVRASAAALALGGALGGQSAAAQRSGQDCDAMGATLAAARGAYAEACPSVPRVDCDPVVGGWACASYRIGDAAPGMPPSGQPAASSSGGSPGVGQCRWVDASLDAARAGYLRMCRPALRDCDPVPEGWMCSSTQIGASMPGAGFYVGAVPDPVIGNPVGPGGDGPANSPTEPLDPDAPSAPEEPGGPNAPGGPSEPGGAGTPSGPDEPGGSAGPNDPGPAPSPDEPAPAPASLYDGRFGEPSVSWADSYSANGVCYPATNGDHGVFELMVDTPTGPATVREAIARLEPGPGISRADALYNDVRCGRGPANDVGDEDPDQCPGRVDRGRAGCATIGPDWRFAS